MTEAHVYHDVITRTGANWVLEIGFHHGESANHFLVLGCTVISIDVNTPSIYSDRLLQQYPMQFGYLCMDSKDIISSDRKIMWRDRFDLAFIDGDHDSPGVELDAIHCIQLGIPYLLFDDTLHQGHQNIRECIDRGVADGTWQVIAEYTANCGKTLVQVL
jgi:hypothetical protein